MPQKDTKDQHFDKLTPQQMGEFHEAFSLFDKDGDGHITSKELGTVMLALGQHPTENDLKNIIDEVDVEGDGTVTFSEFLYLIAPRMNDCISQADIEKSFRVLDDKMEQVVSAQKLRHMWMTMGEKLSKEEIDETFSKHDIDPDGQVTYKQFNSMMVVP